MTTEKDYANIAPIYDQTRYQGGKARFTSEREGPLLREVLARFAPARGLLLDVACGSGHFTAQVAGLFSRVVGVDLTPAMLTRAVETNRAFDGRVSFVRGSANAVPVLREVADVVMTTRFLHLFPRQEHRRLLSLMMGPLKPGGLLLVEHDSPMIEGLTALVRKLRGRTKDAWSSYHPSERPEGARLLARIGVSAPGLPTLSLAAPPLARALARLFVGPPLNRLSTFVIVAYRKDG